MKPLDILPTLALILLVTGCDGLQSVPAGAADDSTARPVPTASPWLLTGFQVPESALYDPVDDVYYVSNVGDPFGGGGFISRIEPGATGDISGEVDYVWIDGLTSPFGMALAGDVLHVVDRDGLYSFAIDRASGSASPLGFVALGGEGSLLNDVCMANDGTIYVTDTGLDLVDGPTGTDAIYRIVDGEASTLLAGVHLLGPNGCYVDGANIYWTTFFSNVLYRTNPSTRIFEVATLPAGEIDSVVRYGGFFFLSSWAGEGIFRTSRGGSQALHIATVATPGDMGLDTQRDRLLVPSVFSETGAVHVIPLD